MEMVTSTKGKCLGWMVWTRETGRVCFTVPIKKKEVTTSTMDLGKTTCEKEIEAPVFIILETCTWVTGSWASVMALASFSRADAINIKVNGVMM